MVFFRRSVNCKVYFKHYSENGKKIQRNSGFRISIRFYGREALSIAQKRNKTKRILLLFLMVSFFKSGSKSLEALDLMNYIHLIALFQKNQQTLPSTILGYQQNLQRFAKVPDQTHRLHLVYHNQDEAHLVMTK